MSQDKISGIVSCLDSLLREDDVLATMVSAKSGQNVSPPPEKFKVKQLGIWKMISASISDAFTLFLRFQNFGIDKIYLELGDYEVIFFLIDPSTVLVCVIPALANKGLLEVELENSRRQIRSIMHGVP